MIPLTVLLGIPCFALLLVMAGLSLINLGPIREWLVRKHRIAVQHARGKGPGEQ